VFGGFVCLFVCFVVVVRGFRGLVVGCVWGGR